MRIATKNLNKDELLEYVKRLEEIINEVGCGEVPRCIDCCRFYGPEGVADPELCEMCLIDRLKEEEEYEETKESIRSQRESGNR